MAEIEKINDVVLAGAVAGVAQANGGRIYGTPFVKNNQQWYRIAAGDMLSYIALYFKTTVKSIQILNANIKNPDQIYPGQEIRIF